MAQEEVHVVKEEDTSKLEVYSISMQDLLMRTAFIVEFNTQEKILDLTQEKKIQEINILDENCEDTLSEIPDSEPTWDVYDSDEIKRDV